VARSLLYTGPGGAAGVLPVSVKTTIAIAGNAVNVAQETSQPSSQRLSATFVTAGSDITITQTCPKAEVITSKYSAGTDLTMMLPNDKGQIVAYTYRR